MGSGDSDCSDGNSAGNVEGENENKTKETKTKEENIMWRAWQDNEQDIGTSEDECGGGEGGGGATASLHTHVLCPQTTMTMTTALV